MLRFATKEDAKALREIYRPYVTDSVASFEYLPPTVEEFAQRIEDCIDAGNPFLVATHQGKLLGYACVHPYALREAYKWSVETSIYLNSEVHRCKVGTKLYNALFAICRAQGYREAWAIVSNPNDLSDAFHLAYGFEDCGILPHIGYKMGRWLGIRNWHFTLIPGDDAPEPIKRVEELPVDFVEKILKENA